MRKILLVSLITLVVAALVFATFRQRARVAAQNPARPAKKYLRNHDRGIPADFSSDVPGVQLVVLGVLPDDTDPSGAGETALLRVINNTGRGIDAYTVGGGDEVNHNIEGEEVGWDEQGGFTLDPPAPLIPPHGQRDLRFNLANLQDGWPLHLYAVKWHGGGYNGSAYGQRDLEGALKHHSEERGRKGARGTQ